MAHYGDLVAEMLLRYGVTHVFGQPGGQTAALYDGIARRSPHIRHVLIRDERSGAYAADAFARLTGRPGVCDVTVGPGTTKLADGLVESYNASVPVIALVGELPRDWAPYREMGVASQGFDQVRFLSSITKSTLEVPTTAALPQLIRSAYRIATTGRPGPVALVIPHDLLDAEWVAGDADLEVDDRYARAPAHRPIASQDSVRAAADLLKKARRPVIVAGGGVHASRATEQLTALTSHNWTLPLAEQATIHLDADAAELGRTFRPTVALNGDVRSTLEALLAIIGQVDHPDWRRETAEIKALAAGERAEFETSDAVPILPPRIMREVSARLGPTDVVISDASFSAGWIASHIPARQAGRRFLFARGQGGLGYAVPAAIGAAAATPNGRVITVSGDGGFSYAIGELATHAQQGLRTVNIVLNNGTLSWLAIWQRLFFDGLRESVDLEGEGLNPNFATVATGLGCVGIRVERPEEIGEALDAAFAASRPVVVDVRTDPMATPIHSYRRRLAEGKSYPRPGTVYQLQPWRRSPELPPVD